MNKYFHKDFLLIFLSLLFKSRKNIRQFKEAAKQHYIVFFAMGLLESLSALFHFMGMEHIFIGLVTAFKRAGTIIISTALGHFLLNEKITK